MYSIILPTYNNPKYLKLCVDSLIENSYYKTHQLCVHINGYNKKAIEYLHNKDITYTLTHENVGIPSAVNICALMATYDKLFLANDDYYFTKNWDYYLHEWEKETEKMFPGYINFIACRLAEPNLGSYPPICDCGKDIKSFDINKLNKHIKENSSHEVDMWLYNSIIPKDLFINIKGGSKEFSPKSCCDIDFAMKLLNYLKNKEYKFLIFSVKDSWVYHFQRKSTINDKNESNSDIFEDKWKIGVENAYNLLHNESKRSIKIISEKLNLNKHI